MPRFIYRPRQDDPAATRTQGVAFVAGEAVLVPEAVAVALRGNPWFSEVIEGEAVQADDEPAPPRRGPGRPRKVA